MAFLAPEQRPDPEKERARYAEHHNDPGDARYRAHLERIAGPLTEQLAPGACGLDYGCGPGPALAAMMEERGFRMRVYDPYFAADADALKADYDFITCTETVEHFFFPAAEFERLDRLLRPGGRLGIMTQALRDDRVFADWHYMRDATHVCFYGADTLRWIARRYGWQVTLLNDQAAIFLKSGSGTGERP